MFARFIALSVLLVGTTASFGVEYADVCIVGAGIGGLGTAIYLQDAGKKVAVFEKNDRTGGKVYSPRIEGANGEVRQDLGATITSADYPEVNGFAQRFGLPLRTPSTAFALDPSTGLHVPLATVLQGSAQEIQAAAQQFAAIVSQPEYSWVQERAGFGHVNITPTLRQPILYWLIQNNLTPLTPVFSLLLSNFGFGNLVGQDPLTAVATMYALRSVTVNHLFATLAAALNPELPPETTWGSFPDGFQSLTDAMTAEIQDLHLGVEVSVWRCPAWVPRCPAPAMVFIDNRVRYLCDSIVAAFAPTVANLEQVFDLSVAEASLFSHVTANDYFSGAFRASPPYAQAPELNLVPFLACDFSNGTNCLPDLPGANYLINDPNNGRTNVGAMFTYNAGSNVWGADVYAADQASFQQQVVAQTTLIGDPAPVFIDETYNEWQFWPHFVPDDIELHAVLESLQGHRRTYYLSGLNNFEITGRILEYARQLVNENLL